MAQLPTTRIRPTRERPDEEFSKIASKTQRPKTQHRPHHEWRRHQHLRRVPENHRTVNQVNTDAYVQKHPPTRVRTDHSREGNSIPPIRHQQAFRNENGTSPLCHDRSCNMDGACQPRTTASVPTTSGRGGARKA